MGLLVRQALVSPRGAVVSLRILAYQYITCIVQSFTVGITTPISRYKMLTSLPSSQIPRNLGKHLTNLVELDISRNSLCGEIPSSIGGIRKVNRAGLAIVTSSSSNVQHVGGGLRQQQSSQYYCRGVNDTAGNNVLYCTVYCKLEIRPPLLDAQAC